MEMFRNTIIDHPTLQQMAKFHDYIGVSDYVVDVGGNGHYIMFVDVDFDNSYLYVLQEDSKRVGLFFHPDEAAKFAKMVKEHGYPSTGCKVQKMGFSSLNQGSTFYKVNNKMSLKNSGMLIIDLDDFEVS